MPDRARESERPMEDDIRDVLSGDSRIEAIYLHGSALTGRLRPDSDIDIGLLTERGIDLDTKSRIHYSLELERRIGREIDLGVVSSRNLVYTAEVILRGNRIFARDRDRVELTEATLLGMWVRFNEERQEVLNAYTAG